jgi:hypothetical protein
MGNESTALYYMDRKNTAYNMGLYSTTGGQRALQIIT